MANQFGCIYCELADSENVVFPLVNQVIVSYHERC